MTASTASGVTPPGAIAAQTPEDLIRRLRDPLEDPQRRTLLSLTIAGLGSDPVVASLKAEAERLWYVDPHASSRLADCIVLCGEIARRPDHVALGLMARGDALRFLGRYPESLDCLDDAGGRFLELGDEVGWARTRIGWVVSTHRLGRGLEIFDVVERARDVLVRHGERLRAAGLSLNTAWVCSEMGRYEQALRLYDEAQALYHSLGAEGEIRAAWATANKAIVLTLFGDFRAALEQHHLAREVFARRGETVAVLRQDQNIAHVHAGLGDYTRALRLLTDAFAAAEAAGLEVDATAIALKMVECYLSLNRFAEASDLGDEIIERCARHGAPMEGAKARISCAVAAAHLGDTRRARTLLEDARQTFVAAQFAQEQGLLRLHRAALHLADGEWTLAGDEAREAQSIFATRGLAVRQAQATLIEARATLGQGEHQRAARLARAALGSARTRGVDWLDHEGQHVLATVARARGNHAGALRACHRAVLSIERVQSRLAGELRSNFLDDKLAVYHDAIDLCLHLDRPADAFAYLERAKSRALVDYLASNPQVRVRASGQAEQELLDELARLRREHNWFYSRLYGHGPVATAEGGRPAAEDAILEQAIKEREKRIGRLLERLALRQADASTGVVAPPRGPALAPPPLDTGTVLLEYYFREQSGVVFVLTAGGVTAVPLVARADEIERLLRLWHLSLVATSQAVARGSPLGGLRRNALGTLAALYRHLVQPVAEHLTGFRRLVVVPYGPSHAVPWHALFDGERHLIEAFEVATCPSSGLLRLCTSRSSPDPGQTAGTSALVMAYSDGGRLPHVVQEALTVARLFPGESYVEEHATGARLVASAPRHGILHLAAHGEARLDNPAFAHLQLADGQLTTADVFNLPIEGALVTLSACETGRSVVTGGDELVGLARGFLHAGATSLVQSLWRVEDASTARLMQQFYGKLRDGVPVAAALRLAQLSELATGTPPYLWGAFQLVGDGGPAERRSPPRERQPAE